MSDRAWRDHCDLIEVKKQRDDWKSRCDKLQAFKNWVHAYLDTHGVPHHPPGPHGAEGCRVGDRMDWLMAKLANAEQAADHIAAEAEHEPGNLADAFRQMAEAAGGRWDGVDAVKYVADLRGHTLQAERDALAVTVERQAEQIKRLREALDFWQYFYHFHGKGLATEQLNRTLAILKETAPPA